jgi:hypothetical protein
MMRHFEDIDGRKARELVSCARRSVRLRSRGYYSRGTRGPLDEPRPLAQVSHPNEPLLGGDVVYWERPGGGTVPSASRSICPLRTNPSVLNPKT